jgi:hypothetical protein
MTTLPFSPTFWVAAMRTAAFSAAYRAAATDTFEAGGRTASLRLVDGSPQFVDVEKGAWVYLFYVPFPSLDAATKQFITSSIEAIAS